MEGPARRPPALSALELKFEPLYTGRRITREGAGDVEPSNFTQRREPPPELASSAARPRRLISARGVKRAASAERIGQRRRLRRAWPLTLGEMGAISP